MNLTSPSASSLITLQSSGMVDHGDPWFLSGPIRSKNSQTAVQMTGLECAGAGAKEAFNLICLGCSPGRMKTSPCNKHHEDRRGEVERLICIVLLNKAMNIRPPVHAAARPAG